MDSPSNSDVQPTFTDQALLEALKILEQLAADRGLLARLGKEDCSRLIQAAEAIAKALKKK